MLYYVALCNLGCRSCGLGDFNDTLIRPQWGLVQKMPWFKTYQIALKS